MKEKIGLQRVLSKYIKRRKYFRRRIFKKCVHFLNKFIFKKYNNKNIFVGGCGNKKLKRFNMLSMYKMYRYSKVLNLLKYNNDTDIGNLGGGVSIMLWKKIILEKCINKKYIYVQLLQKTNNIKCVIHTQNTTHYTFSVGSILKYFKIRGNKALRRSTKSTGMLLNFMRLILKKRYINYTPILSVVGFNYNLLMVKKQIKELLQEFITAGLNNNTTHSLGCGHEIIGSNSFTYFLFNLKLNFSKKKTKRIKAIKKRLSKKILLDFLKTINTKH